MSMLIFAKKINTGIPSYIRVDKYQISVRSGKSLNKINNGGEWITMAQILKRQSPLKSDALPFRRDGAF